jgi:hypothetical protein
LDQFITESGVPSEIPQIDKLFEPEQIRGFDHTEEAGLAGILRDWSVEDLILDTGSDGGVDLWAS